MGRIGRLVRVLYLPVISITEELTAGGVYSPFCGTLSCANMLCTAASYTD